MPGGCPEVKILLFLLGSVF